MILKIRGAFLFYRQFLIASVLLNFLLFFFNNPFVLVVLVKILLTALTYYVYKTTYKNQLIFYQNLGLNTAKLLVMAFILDFILVGLSAYIYSLLL